MDGVTETWLTVVAPDSVKSWFTLFANSSDSVLFVGEDRDDPVVLADMIEARAAGASVRIHSGHDSLLRDWSVARELAARSVVVQSQSGMSVAAGSDKVLQKQLLDLAKVPVPTWGDSGTAIPVGIRALIKGRSSTQSRGLSWARPGDSPPAGSYWEEFVPGVEYSIVLHCSPHGRTAFPPVWKGSAREDLLPPWRRLRLVPSGLPPMVAKSLQDTAIAVAQLIDAWGFVEVEFIVPVEGSPMVIDVNPRICGTMRIAAMATQVPLFDLGDRAVFGDHFIGTVRFAAEIPYHGAPFSGDDVVATSRLTCANNSAKRVREILTHYGHADAAITWPEVWLDH